MKRKRKTVSEKPEQQRRRRLLVEAKKLNRKEERDLAEEGMTVRTGRLNATPPERV